MIKVRCSYCEGTGKLGFQREDCCFCFGKGYEEKECDCMEYKKVYENEKHYGICYECGEKFEL